MNYKVMVRPDRSNVALGLSEWNINKDSEITSSYATDRFDFYVFENRESAVEALEQVKDAFGPHKIYLRKVPPVRIMM